MRTSLTPNSFSVVFCLNPWVAGSQQKVVRRCMVVDVSRRFASAFQSLKRHYPRIYTHVIPGKFNAVLSKVGSFFHANDVHCHLDSCRLLRPIA
ncbi:hypothetical protein KC348_g58 [Hortaea werneckii]|nr:hypothetical protein KC348_g58 [Hortaea werneckii]